MARKRETRLEPVEAYEYQRLDGSVAWWKVRYLVRDAETGEVIGKTFRPWWCPPENKLSGVLVAGDPPFIDRYPYELPRLWAAIEAGETVYLVEGEKDSHSVMDAWGYAASTHPSGVAGGREKAGWSRTQLDWLRKADRQRLRGVARSELVVVVDRDPTGAWLAWRTYRGLIEVAGWDRQRVRLVLPAGDGQHEDVSDHIERGWSPGSLVPVSVGALQRLAGTVETTVRRLGEFRVAFGSGPTEIDVEWLAARRRARTQNLGEQGGKGGASERETTPGEAAPGSGGGRPDGQRGRCRAGR